MKTRDNNLKKANSPASRYIEQLVLKAKKESGDSISFPVKCVEECVTRFDDKLVLWYNDSAGSTQVVSLDLDLHN